MYGVDRRYSVLTAFVTGCHEASGRRLLQGFEEWLLQEHRPGTRSSLGWQGLLIDLVDPALDAPTGEATGLEHAEDDSAPLTKFMFDELDRFLESRIAAANGDRP